jgi:hypothetical protein
MVKIQYVPINSCNSFPGGSLISVSLRFHSQAKRFLLIPKVADDINSTKNIKQRVCWGNIK